MFTKLKLRLTMVNIVVISLIFFLTVTGIFHLMKREMTKQTEQIMLGIAADAGTGDINQIMERELKWIDYFYVETQAGGIISYSPDLPIDYDKLKVLVQKALAADDEKGRVGIWNGKARERVENDNGYYWFYKGTLDREKQSYLIVFFDAKRDEIILRRLFGVLVTAMLTGLTLAFFGSLFMAERALIPIKQAWDRQQNFVADASHELRTPLAVMQTNLELIRGNPTETVASQEKWLQNVIRENQRMAKLVDELLLLARADSNQELLEMKRLMMDEVLRKTLEPFEPVAKSREIALEQLLDSRVEFLGDETRLKQLVVILVDNAVKYTQPGGKVSLVMKDLGGSIKISVSDTGEGIAKEHLEKIFHRFYRVEKARSRKSGSTGLGLSIAQWIVQEHGGTIEVESTQGAGTTFTITLPKK